MTRIFIGLDSTGTACVKATKDSADNPFNTPDAERTKFHYNSKDAKVAEIAAIKPEIKVDTGGAWVNNGDGTHQRGQYFNASQFYYESAYEASAFDNLDYFCPLVDYKFKDASGKGVDLEYLSAFSGRTSSGGFAVIGARPNYYLSGVAIPPGTTIGGDEQHQIPTTGYTYPVGSGYPSTTVVPFNRIQSYNQKDAYPTGSAVAVVWNLPGDNVSVLQEAPAVAVPGHKTIHITPSILKIAKPGFDVSTATKHQLAFSAEKKPVKIIASGDILIGATSTTTFDIGFTVDASIYLDVQYYANGGEIYYPADPSTNYYGAKYYVSGSTVYFENAGVECRARFIVIAVDTLGPSTGSNKVFQQFEEGGQQVVRLLAPGSADPPRLSDIVMDSRWPTMPVLAEGYETIAAGAQTVNIDFDNLGMKPFVKLSVIRSSASPVRAFATQPVVRRLSRTGYTMGGDAVYGVVTNSDTRFTLSTFRDEPINALLSGGQVVEWYMPSVIGVRYYIFGIPA